MAKVEKTKDLPGMEDRVIQDLHDAALEYDSVKKQRMKLTAEEVKKKTAVRDLMHKHKRKHYAYDGIEVTLEPPDGDDKVKVVVKSAEAEADADEE